MLGRAPGDLPLTSERAGEPVNFVDDNGVDLLRLNIFDDAAQCWAVHGSAGISAVTGSHAGWQMQIERLQQEDLNRIWQAVRKDKDGARALAILKKHGFDLKRIPVESYTWPGMIACIPFLPSRRARSRLLPRPYGLRLAIRFLRELARSLASPYSSVEARDPRAKVIYMKASDELNPQRFVKAADFLEKVVSWKWVITEHNSRQNAVALLRWEIDWRTKRPHDTELADLLDAAFRAGGFKEGFQMQFESLKKTETYEKETRKAARRKLLHDRPR